MHNQSGTLFVVATPIGNLADVSQRALQTLTDVDLILAEDTRHTQRLLKAYGIKTRVQSHHAHNEHAQVESIISRLQQGENIALVSDAGTPLISDPGQQTIAACRQAGCTVVPIPGACALIAALSAAGLATHEFTFIGFLPPKTGAREKALQGLMSQSRTLILYEAPHRILALCESLNNIFGPERQMVVAREITKQFETFISGTIEECLQQVRDNADNQRGEFVVMLAGSPAVETAAEAVTVPVDALLATLLQSQSVKQAAAQCATLTGLKKNALYQRALQLQSDNADEVKKDKANRNRD